MDNDNILFKRIYGDDESEMHKAQKKRVINYPRDLVNALHKSEGMANLIKCYNNAISINDNYYVLNLSPGEIYLALKEYGVEYPDIDICYNLAQCNTTKYSGTKHYTTEDNDGAKAPFIIQDILGFAKEIGCKSIYDISYSFPIDPIIIEKGCIEGHDDSILVTTAYVSYGSFPNDKYYCPLLGEFPIGERLELPLHYVININCKALESIGFVNINDYVGYEFKEAYIYPNEMGKKVIKAMMNHMNNN